MNVRFFLSLPIGKPTIVDVDIYVNSIGPVSSIDMVSVSLSLSLSHMHRQTDRQTDRQTHIHNINKNSLFTQKSLLI